VRERLYNKKGIDCYMFRIDQDIVVDATMNGNSSRFINHSCEVNISFEFYYIHLYSIFGSNKICLPNSLIVILKLKQFTVKNT